jgi:predicted house-cleaning noncanonical NTP pyrophosphatase (MazG superfamily)
MTETIHNKLVRDKIPARIRANGEECKTHTLSSVAFREALCAKIAEELREVFECIDYLHKLPLNVGPWATPGEEQVLRARRSILEELADVQFVLDALRTDLGFTSLELNDAVCEKLRSHGGFSQRLLLTKTWRPE